eukprot:3740171-Alexandrium_andersonii.AAC.1
MPHLCDFGRGARACATLVGARARVTSVGVPVPTPQPGSGPVCVASRAYGALALSTPGHG